MIKITIHYRYTREIRPDQQTLRMEYQVHDFDVAYELTSKIHEDLDDAGYTISHVDISEEVIFP